MNSSWNTIKTIFAKDLLTELRAKQLLPTMIMFGLIIVWIFRLVTADVSAVESTAAAAVLLIAILFATIMASEKSFAIEQQNNCLSALVLAATDAGDIYLGKLLVNIVMLCLFEIITVPAVFILFNTAVPCNWTGFVTVLLLVNIGLSSAGTLLGAAVQGTRAANSLLSVLIMVILCPMMIPAVFLLLSLLGSVSNGLTGSTFNIISDFKTAIGYITAFDALFVTVCWLLFGFAVKE